MKFSLVTPEKGLFTFFCLFKIVLHTFLSLAFFLPNFLLFTLVSNVEEQSSIQVVYIGQQKAICNVNLDDQKFWHSSPSKVPQFAFKKSQ